MGGIMGFEYTVLPDGSIFKLAKPSDYVCAAQIVRDEVGDDSGDGLCRPWVSLSARDDD